MAGGERPSYAKQTQFADGPMNANCCPPKGLGEIGVHYVSAKTKPICQKRGCFPRLCEGRPCCAPRNDAYRQGADDATLLPAGRQRAECARQSQFPEGLRNANR